MPVSFNVTRMVVKENQKYHYNMERKHIVLLLDGGGVFH